MIIDPKAEDWTKVDDGDVWYAAIEAGIPEALAEAKKRGLLEPAPDDGLG